MSYSKDDYFFKNNCTNFLEKAVPTLVSFRPFCKFKVWKNSLSKINSINFERKKVFHFQTQSSVTVLSRKLLIKICQNSLATLLSQRLWRRCISVKLANLTKHLKLTGSGFWTVMYVSLHNSFHQVEQ